MFDPRTTFHSLFNNLFVCKNQTAALFTALIVLVFPIALSELVIFSRNGWFIFHSIFLSDSHKTKFFIAIATVFDDDFDGLFAYRSSCAITYPLLTRMTKICLIKLLITLTITFAMLRQLPSSHRKLSSLIDRLRFRKRQ